jgi:predicted TIM-barrel enzyme
LEKRIFIAKFLLPSPKTLPPGRIMSGELFRNRVVIGYVHASSRKSFAENFNDIKVDIYNLAEGGIDAVVVESYIDNEEAESLIESLSSIIKDVPKGVNYGSSALKSYEVAVSAGYDFIHADTFADSKENTGDALARELYELKGTSGKPLLVKLKPHHEHAGYRSLEEVAERSIELGADALAVWGKGGTPPYRDDIDRLFHLGRPVGPACGVTCRNVHKYLDPAADFFLASRAFRGGDSRSERINPDLVKSFMKKVKSL